MDTTSNASSTRASHPVLTQGGRDKEEQDRASIAIWTISLLPSAAVIPAPPASTKALIQLRMTQRLWCLKLEAIRLEMINTLKKRHIEDLKVNPVLYEVWPSREEFNQFLRRHLSDEGLWPQ